MIAKLGYREERGERREGREERGEKRMMVPPVQHKVLLKSAMQVLFERGSWDDDMG